MVGFTSSSQSERADTVVGEEPLEVRLGSSGSSGSSGTVGVIMRTPGHDFELAVGFLYSEGLLRPGDLRSVRYCVPQPGMRQLYNIVTVTTAGPMDPGSRRRELLMNASCGICGTSTLEQLDRRCTPLPVADQPVVEAAALLGLPDELRRHQPLFDRTGGLHGAGLFRTDGSLLAVREDVGRHNAVDKLIGWALMQQRLPLSDVILTVSGRVSYEIVQKALLAGIPMLVAVSAPSDLAVATAERFNMTLVAFVRGDRGNVYSCPQRLQFPAVPAASGQVAPNG